MMDEDFMKAVAASLETGCPDLDMSLERNRERAEENARARARLLQWQPPARPDFAERMAHSEERAARHKRKPR